MKKIIITVILTLLVLVVFAFEEFDHKNIELTSLNNINMFKSLGTKKVVDVVVPKELPDTFENKKVIEVAPCDLSGDRKKNVVVDIGYDDREYWSTTNEFGQVVEVYAPQIIIQEKKEVNESGRYCSDEAKVDGVESTNLDEGHIIADSLGGGSNSYNITPQESKLNRQGEQYQMEDEIRQEINSGFLITEFDYKIEYSDNHTMIPETYRVSYKSNGKLKKIEFENK